MNSPKLRFSEFEREWGKFSLNDITEFIDSLHETPEDYVESGYPMIRVADVNGNALDLKKCLKVTKEVYEHFTKRYKPQFGDIVFSRVGTCGESVLINFNNEVCLGQNVVLLKPRESYQFLFHYLNTKLIKSQVDKKVVGSSHKTLSLKDAKRFLVSAPCKQEQTKIANFLTAVDEKITQLTQKSDLLAQYKKGVMQKIFSQELRFKDDDGREFPEWKEATLGQIAKFRRGSFPQPYGLAKWYDDTNGMPFIQVFDVDDNFKLKNTTKRKISKEAQLHSVFVEAGSILVTIQGSIGRIAVTQYDAFVDRTLLLFESFKVHINKHYFAYILFLLFEIEKEKAPGGIIKTITKEVLTDFKTLICNYDEQTKIANFLTAIDDKITATQTQLEAVKQYKQGLLQQMFV